ncbi:AAC(3) family N-acetyltransferase [Chondromyces apiculatus]|uniref:Aminoglycoside N(3)-acetyltransferase n=1 Tax=Chondromyces apiculatus DSM 436 TaxID=1192034 RepID=A0A017T2W9_9BACT|nr:AAC(3) family N-acetyltransferase [Chondromyces apiculatus]EYF03553.1 putative AMINOGLYCOSIDE N3'-ACETYLTRANSFERASE PROTEIN [Chondromyces apiculatus DSM 436]
MNGQPVPGNIRQADVTTQLRALGVAEGGVLLVHTSFRATRPVEGGPRGLIAALREALGPHGTLVMPSWSGDDQVPFDPRTAPTSPDLGVAADTTLHLAELLAGVPYRVPKQCTVLAEGRPVRIDYGENDHCCAGFVVADAWLRERGLQREGRVGHAHARLARARDIVQVAREHLAENPLLFLHPPGAGCADCDEARTSVVA